MHFTSDRVALAIHPCVLAAVMDGHQPQLSSILGFLRGSRWAIVAVLFWLFSARHVLPILCVLPATGAQAVALWELKYSGHLMDVARGEPLNILGEAGYSIAINSILRFDPGQVIVGNYNLHLRLKIWLAEFPGALGVKSFWFLNSNLNTKLFPTRIFGAIWTCMLLLDLVVPV